MPDGISPTPNSLTPPLKRTLGEDVVDGLRQAIVSGQFAPNERLREELLSEMLQVSRGPIREALAQLEREGLVIREPNRSATVARLSFEDLEEVFSLRLALEQLAVRQAVQHATPVHLKQMQAILDQIVLALNQGLMGQEAATLDLGFHEVIYQASQHRRLYEFWSILRPQIHIFLLTRNVANPDFREQILSGHQAIFEAIRDKDEARAVTLIQDHITAAYTRVLKSYTQSISDSTPK